MRRFLLLVPLVLLLTVAGVGLFRASPRAGLGGPAPAFSLPTLADPDVRMGPADLRGRPAVLNFWASWCAPCRDEAPELAEVSASVTDVAFLGVNILDGRDPARDYEREFGIAYPSVRDATGRIPKLYRVTGAPETFFLDAEGLVVGRFIGAFPSGLLADLVDDLRRLPPGETLRITGTGDSRPIP